MTKKVKTTNFEVIAEEHYGDNCLGDSAFIGQSDPRRPKGWVEVWEENPNTGKKKLLNKSNLIVYLGREMLVQRLFDVENTTAQGLDPTFPTKDEFLYWMGFGSGGVVSANPLVPTPPTLLFIKPFNNSSLVFGFQITSLSENIMISYFALLTPCVMALLFPCSLLRTLMFL